MGEVCLCCQTWKHSNDPSESNLGGSNQHDVCTILSSVPMGSSADTCTPEEGIGVVSSNSPGGEN